MKRMDEMILNATPEQMSAIRDLDLETQLDGRSFYDSYIESKIRIPKTINKTE